MCSILVNSPGEFDKYIYSAVAYMVLYGIQLLDTLFCTILLDWIFYNCQFIVNIEVSRPSMWSLMLI